MEYFHILFAHHEVIIANGARAESLYTAPEGLKGVVGTAVLEEIYALFPSLNGRAAAPPRILVPGRLGGNWPGVMLATASGLSYNE